MDIISKDPIIVSLIFISAFCVILVIFLLLLKAFRTIDNNSKEKINYSNEDINNSFNNIFKRFNNIIDRCNNDFGNNFTKYTYEIIKNDFIEELKDKKPLNISINYNKDLQYFINGNFCKDYNIDVYTNSILNPLITNNKYLKDNNIPNFIIDEKTYGKVPTKTYPNDKKSKIYISIEKDLQITFYVISDTEEKKLNIMKEIQEYILKQVELFKNIENKY